MKFRREDTALTTIGLLAGLAVGAAVSALFAPKRGTETRDDIARCIKGLFGAENDKPVEIKEQAVEDLRAHTKEVADHLAAADADSIDTTKTTLKQTGPKSRQLPI